MSKSNLKKEDISFKGDLNIIKADILKNVEDGNLIIITVGNNEHIPSRDELSYISDNMSKVFNNVKGVKVLVLPHTITVQKMELPQLRTIINNVIVAPLENTNVYNPIIDLDVE